MGSATKGKTPGATALDYVKTDQKIEAGLAAKEAAAKAGKAAQPGGADPTHDSPKRHGDKLEHARDAAAGRGKDK
ncbi:MAG TPA: hypothetical protein VHN20_18430 [Beijerinckiaceae bacterium]|nr:hypothetical protein [Beijerinckiaceae bacterium]